MSDQDFEFTDASDLGFTDASADLFEDASEVDPDHESALREIVGPDYERQPGPVDERDAEEIDDVIRGFRERASKEAARDAQVTLADCYIVVCFATQAQREEFIKQAEWVRYGHTYIDGRRVAALMGIDLPPDPDWPQVRRDRTWDDFAMTPAENKELPDYAHEEVNSNGHR